MKEEKGQEEISKEWKMLHIDSVSYIQAVEESELETA